MSRERDKGLGAEREVVRLAKSYGFQEARRSGDAGQWDHDQEDVVGIPGCRMAVKRHERLRITEWAEEVESEAEEGEIPMVVFRRSREPWRVVLPFEDLLTLLFSLHAARFMAGARDGTDG